MNHKFIETLFYLYRKVNRTAIASHRLKYLFYLIDWKSCLENDYPFTGIDWLDEKNANTSIYDIYPSFHNMFDLVEENKSLITRIKYSENESVIQSLLGKDTVNENLHISHTIHHSKCRDFEGYIDRKENPLFDHEKKVIDFVLETEERMKEEHKDDFKWKIVQLCLSTFPEISCSGCEKRKNRSMSNMAREYKKLIEDKYI